jgi:hypothetical protein
MKEDDRVDIERLGGFAGFGGGHLRSRGSAHGRDLTPAVRSEVASLLDGKTGQPLALPGAADGFRYRLTLASTGKSVEVPESAVPPTLRDKVRDELV